MPTVSSIDLTNSGLPQYLVSPYQLASSASSSRSYSSEDPNSENAAGNDYGDTPSSGNEDGSSNEEPKEEYSSGDDVNFENDDGGKIKRLFRLMDINKHDSDDEYEDNGSDELNEFRRPKRSRHRNKKSKNIPFYTTTAYDAWYHRDQDDFEEY